MQTLFTIENKESGGIQTLLHVTTYTKNSMALVIYVSDEYGNHKQTIRRTFINKIEKIYHKNLRNDVKKKGGIIHTRISDTPLPKSKNK